MWKFWKMWMGWWLFERRIIKWEKKIEEYILELDKEIERLQNGCERIKQLDLSYIQGQVNAYDNVRNDLKSRLEELKYEGDE